MAKVLMHFGRAYAICCLVTAIAVPCVNGDDAPVQVPAEVDQRLLDGLDKLGPLRSRPSADIAGEDLGAAKPESTLAGLARLMHSVEQRIRRNDTSTTTTQLQSDIAGELSKMLESAEEQAASRSSAAAGDQRSDEAVKANSAGTEGNPQTKNGDAPNDPSDLLDAVWGRLPEQLRQQIQSPLQEEFLPRYERVIKQYYKRLAEEQPRLRN